MVKVLGGMGGEVVVVDGWGNGRNRRGSRQENRTASGNRAAVDRVRGFECVCEGIAGSIKTRHKLGFIVDVASFNKLKN